MTVPEVAGSTTIERLACTLAIPVDGIDAAPIKARLERVTDRDLGSTLGAGLVSLDGTDPGAVWVIRSLRADIVVSAFDDEDRLAGRYGGQLADAVLGVLRRGPGGNVVRFGSRAAFLAAFLSAHARGESDMWVFGPLAGLRPLSLASALRTGAERAGIQVIDVVAELADQGRTDAFVAALDRDGTAAVWAACLLEAGVASTGDIERVLDVVPTVLESPSASVETSSGLALRLYAAAARSGGGNPAMVAAVDVLVSTGGSNSHAGAHLRLSFAPESARSSEAPVDVVPERARSTDRRPRVALKPRFDANVFGAAGAAVFMMLPSLDRVGLDAIAGDDPATATAVRRRVLSMLLGRGRVDPSDPAVLLASGAIDPTDAEIDPAAVTAILLRTLRDDDRLRGRQLIASVVPRKRKGDVIGLLRDVETETWLAGALASHTGAIDWAMLVERVAAVVGTPSDVLAGDGCGRSPALTPVPPDARPQHRDARSDIDWLAPADDGELALGLVAQAGLRDLARRLFGFERASIAYLAERFLPTGGVVAVMSERIRVELAPAPLGLILTMTGLDHFSYRVPWLDREVSVAHQAS